MANESLKQRADFATGSVRAHILRLAVPMTVAQLVNILYSIVDRMYLGRMQDTGMLALTGIGIVMPVISILTSVASLCGTGGAPLCSIARGRGDNDEAERIMGTSFSLLLILGVVMTTVVIALKEPLLILFGASGETLPYAEDYLTIYTLGTIFVMIGLGLNPFVNSQGAAKRGMMTVTLGAAVNIVLDPLFIFVFHMGIKGAALATIIAQFCSAMWVLAFLTGKKAIIRLRFNRMKLQARRVLQIVGLGMSGFCMSMTTSLIQIVCNATLQSYGGDLYVGAMTVINAVREVVFMAVNGLNNGATPVMSYNYGAQRYDRLKTAIRFSVIVTMSYALLVVIVTMAFPGALFRVFNNEPELIAVGVRAMRIYFVMFVFMSMQTSAQVVFLALGKSKRAIFFSLLRKAIIAAPLTVLLPLIGFGTDGVFFAEAISQLVGGLVCGGAMYFTLYRKLPSEPTNAQIVV
ncbi:MAG: MATE family efflux transporter [Oscillospiraceae bacterium]|jgi:putative MATE family efflux protein|nr:MATE family efflux transporter [Oscillospiraceae bacterium]